jgi:hypothetical protein
MEHFAQGSPLGLATWPSVLGKEASIPEWYALGRYTCDGVSLREEVKKQGTEWEEPGLRISELRHLPTGSYEVTLEATLYNPKGNGDRLVTLAYEILDSEKAVIQTAQRTYKLEAKAKSGENADVDLLVPSGDMPRVALLRLTITTKAFDERDRADSKPEPVQEFVSEDLVPSEKRLKPLPNYKIVTIRETEPDGTTRVYQVYAAPDKPRSPVQPPPTPTVKPKPVEEIVSEDLVPLEKRLKPLPNYKIVTIRETDPDGTSRVYQRYEAPDKP